LVPEIAWALGLFLIVTTSFDVVNIGFFTWCWY
jgi:hypothetical protein